jgi:hypothetical protein
MEVFGRDKADKTMFVILFSIEKGPEKAPCNPMKVGIPCVYVVCISEMRLVRFLLNLERLRLDLVPAVLCSLKQRSYRLL